MLPTMVNTYRKYVGRSLHRLEDEHFLRGEGTYVANLTSHDALCMAVVRATVAHGRIVGIDSSFAMAMPGVIDVLTGSEIVANTGRFLPVVQLGASVTAPGLPIAAGDHVQFVGQVVAVVLAKSQRAAIDAVNEVIVDYDAVPVISDIPTARSGEYLIHPELGSNIGLRWHGGANYEATTRSARKVRRTFKMPRLIASPLEPRACVASYDSEAESFELVCSAQDPHRPKAQLAELLGLSEEKVRVIVPDVGGAFGAKGSIATEYAIAAYCARRLGRRIRWIEERGENMTGGYQGRGMEITVEIAVMDDGRFAGLKSLVEADLGAYAYPLTTGVPISAAVLMTGNYVFQSAEADVIGYHTNAVPTGPYRGAGRPEAGFCIERIVDAAAAELGFDPVELRRINLVHSSEMPYTTPLGVVLDSGNYSQVLEMTSASLDATYTKVLNHLSPGMLVGKGLSLYIERAAPGFWERGSVEIDPDGLVSASSGSSSHGQGHAISFAQIIADQLGVSPELVQLREGDSEDGDGVGTFGSRSMTLGGEALNLASVEVRRMAVDRAAKYFEVEPEEIVYEMGRMYVTGSPSRDIDIFAVAAEARDAGEPLVSEIRARIEVPVISFGGYGVVVSVDPDTGEARVQAVVAVDDAGTLINPMLAEGQVLGAAMQGIGQALYEEAIYDEDGQLLTGSFLDYLIPSSSEAGYSFEGTFLETPTPYTSLGAKGIGEAGTIALPPAVVAAVGSAIGVVDSLVPDMPLTPEKVWRALAIRKSHS